VYGKNRGSTTAKGRWLARGVETLLWQYPALRVAFLDTNSGGASSGRAGQWSVLVRGLGAEPSGTDSAVEEIYRWIASWKAKKTTGPSDAV